MIWGTQYVNPYFARTTPEDGKVLAFARDVRLVNLPATVETDPAWLDLEERDVPREAYMVDVLTIIWPGMTRIPGNITKSERVQSPLVSATLFSLAHPLMVAPFLPPSNMWHMIDEKF